MAASAAAGGGLPDGSDAGEGDDFATAAINFGDEADDADSCYPGEGESGVGELPTAGAADVRACAAAGDATGPPVKRPQDGPGGAAPPQGTTSALYPRAATLSSRQAPAAGCAAVAPAPHPPTGGAATSGPCPAPAAAKAAEPTDRTPPARALPLGTSPAPGGLTAATANPAFPTAAKPPGSEVPARAAVSTDVGGAPTAVPPQATPPHATASGLPAVAPADAPSRSPAISAGVRALPGESSIPLAAKPAPAAVGPTTSTPAVAAVAEAAAGAAQAPQAGAAPARPHALTTSVANTHPSAGAQASHYRPGVAVPDCDPGNDSATEGPRESLARRMGAKQPLSADAEAEVAANPPKRRTRRG